MPIVYARIILRSIGAIAEDPTVEVHAVIPAGEVRDEAVEFGIGHHLAVVRLTCAETLDIFERDRADDGSPWVNRTTRPSVMNQRASGRRRCGSARPKKRTFKPLSGKAANAARSPLSGRADCFERNDLAAGERALAAVGVDLDGGRAHRVTCSA